MSIDEPQAMQNGHGDYMIRDKHLSEFSYAEF